MDGTTATTQLADRIVAYNNLDGKGLLSTRISNRSRDEQWTLTQTGNWDRAKVDLNGDGDFTDAGETDDTRTHNVANEMLTRDTDTNGTANYTLTHDAVGNLTDDGQSYKFVYDVWGRLRMIKNQSNNLVAEYRYNGLNQRLSWHYDTDADGDCDSNDKNYYFAYDDQWRVVATFRDSDTSPKERFLYHAAGLGGYGGASGGIGGYIDHCILRDKDANTAWDTASDGTLEERMYYCQNWRADVPAILTSSGKLVEWIKYSAYGTATALPTGDTDSDGDYDINDLGNMGGGYELRKDAELDGDVDGNDVNYAIANGYQTLGRGVLSSSYVANRKGYAGYENDGAIVRFAHVRNRVLDSTLGRWTRRDPIGYVDGSNLYEYVRSAAIRRMDSSGLRALPGNACNGYNGNIHENTCSPSASGSQPAVPSPTRPTQPTPQQMCDDLCDGNPSARAMVVCVNGTPMVCNCSRHPDNPTNPNWEPDIESNRDSFFQCIVAFERRNVSTNIACCPPAPYSGPATTCGADDDWSFACRKAENYRQLAACMARINCQTEQGCNSEARCKVRKCWEIRLANCVARAFDYLCANGSAPFGQDVFIELVTNCGADAERYMRECEGDSVPF